MEWLDPCSLEVAAYDKFGIDKKRAKKSAKDAEKAAAQAQEGADRCDRKPSAAELKKYKHLFQ